MPVPSSPLAGAAVAIVLMIASPAQAVRLADLDADTVEARFTALHAVARVWEICSGDFTTEQHRTLDRAIVRQAGGNLGAGRKLSALDAGQRRAAGLTSAGCGSSQVDPWLAAFEQRLLPSLEQP